MTPTISVIIPAYNADAYLADAVQSALHQTRRPDEIIVVDDGSTDQTPQVASSFGNSIRYVRQPNSGVMATRNRGIAEAKGDWIAFLDADDIWFPRKLELQLAALETISSDCLLCSQRVTFAGKCPPPPEIVLGPTPIRIPISRLLQRNYVGTSTALVPKTKLLDAGGFSQRYNHAEDWALWLRIAAAGTPVYQLPQTLTAWRAAQNSLGTRAPRYLRDVEIQIIKDFVREHGTGISSFTVKMALAGNHIRTALNYSSVHRYRDALQETLRSVLKWPFSLPEYSQNKRLPRARMIAHYIRSLVDAPVGIVPPT